VRGSISMVRVSSLIGVLILLASAAFAGTYTANSCSQGDVNDCINGTGGTCVGGAHTAVDGDIINIPSGSCTWTSGITVPSSIGITIIGSGTPNVGASTTGASSSCGSGTTITLSGGFTAFGMTPTYGNSTTRLSCLTITYSSGAAIGFKILGTCTSSGCPNLRMDNLTFSSWAGHINAGISYGIGAVGNMFGVLDHNIVNGTANNYLQLVEVSHAGYLGVGQYGDNAWHLAESYGTANFLFIENNQFNTSGCCENEGSAGGLGNQGGSRVVVRFNTYANMDHLNFPMGFHGTESSGRPRSVRAIEYYDNAWTCAAATDCISGPGVRGGTGLIWGNTSSIPSGSDLQQFFTLTTYRVQGSPGGWPACDGNAAYDTNDGTTYYSGTIGSFNSGTNTITVSGSPGWITNQWSPNGAPYSVHDVTQITGAEISANGAGTLTLNGAVNAGAGGAWTPAGGDSIQILRATVCIDQAGGRGAGTLYTGTGGNGLPTPVSAASEVASPTYTWNNSFSGGGSAPSTAVVSFTSRVINKRDFYMENVSQAAQSSATTPFDGSTTIGMGHGTLANQPTTCTTGVGYFATDQGTWDQGGAGGVLDLCTATNTWTTSYTPYTYPHPLTQPANPPTPFPAILAKGGQQSRHDRYVADQAYEQTNRSQMLSHFVLPCPVIEICQSSPYSPRASLRGATDCRITNGHGLHQRDRPRADLLLRRGNGHGSIRRMRELQWWSVQSDHGVGWPDHDGNGPDRGIVYRRHLAQL
jgi:hypothetical protein